MSIIEPTGEQCSARALVFEDEQHVGYAIWYPQMGGYAGKAVALLHKQWVEYGNGSREGGCIDVYVWHDGRFPFSDASPVELHHCDPEQFIDFGQALHALNESRKRLV